MRESKKKSILQSDNQRGHHVQIKDAVLIKIQIGLASYLKRQRCENYKKKKHLMLNNISDMSRSYLLTLNTLEQIKLSKYWACLSG